MQTADGAEFKTVLAGVHALYGKELSEFVLGVWWQAMLPFDLAAVRDALNRHCVDPDTGQWMPKPADVVKLIGGRAVDGAMVAWSKAERALRQVGTYETVAFDDPIIHAVLNDMGGWISFGQVQEKELPFFQKEFETRYRGYRVRGRLEHYPAKLIGIADATNGQAGFQEGRPKLIGDPERAALVLKGGGQGTGLRIASDFVARKLLDNHA